jgi:hypothetical protein
MRVPVRHLARLARAARNAGAIQQEVPAAAAAASNLQHVRGQAQAALQVEQQVQQHVIPEITTDLFGAVSPVDEAAVKEGFFENRDGHR